ncbi:MAG: hypothetical protein JRC68_07365 [Deltaproteobacteria bacterium]|nr:hypothetical protein [Deltaproteobacteria bacterium]
MGFTKSVADSKESRDIKPKYLTTPESSGILKRYRLEETAITSYGRYTFLGCKQSHVLLPALRGIFEEREFFTNSTYSLATN